MPPPAEPVATPAATLPPVFATPRPTFATSASCDALMLPPCCLRVDVLRDARACVDAERRGVAGVQRRVADRVADSATRARIGRKCPSPGFEQRVQDLIQRDERSELLRRSGPMPPTPVALLNPEFANAAPRLKTTAFCVITMKAPSLASAVALCLIRVFAEGADRGGAPGLDRRGARRTAEAVVGSVLREHTDDAVEAAVRRCRHRG